MMASWAGRRRIGCKSRRGDVDSVEPQQTNQYIRALANVRIRSNPSLDGEILSMIYAGSYAQVLDTDQSGDWYRINHNGLIGWSASAYFELDPDYLPPDAPAQTDTEPEAAVVSLIQPGTVLTQGGADLVQIFEQPDETSSTLGVVRNRGQVVLLTTDADGVWYQVARDEIYGWVLGEFFVSTGEVLSEVPVPPAADAESAPEVVEVRFGEVALRAEPETDAEVILWLRAGDQAEILEIDETGAWYRLGSGGAVGWAQVLWFDDVIPEPPQYAREVEAQYDDVPVRVSPMNSGDVVKNLGRGEVVIVLETVESGEWYLLHLGDGIGWSRSILFTDYVPDPPADAPQVQAQYDDVPLRVAPSYSGGFVTSVNRGDVATVVELDPTGAWYRLNTGDAIGWSRTGLFAEYIPDPPEDARQVEALYTDIPLRQSPSTKADVIRSLVRFEVVRVIDMDTTGMWYRLHAGDAIGWARTGLFADYIPDPPADARQVEALYADVAVRQAPSQNSPLVTTLNRGDVVAVLESDGSGDWLLLHLGDAIGWARSLLFADYIPEPSADAQQVQAQYDAVPIRVNAAVNAEEVVSLQRGDIAAVLEISADSSWYLLRYKDDIGWARSVWFVAVEPKAAGIHPGSKVVSEWTAVRIQEEPDANSFIMDVVRRGESAVVVGIDESGLWYQIEFEGLTGWVAAEWFALPE